jgi:molybdopterin synthase catalytic subunit
MLKSHLISSSIDEETIAGVIRELGKDPLAGAHSIFLGQVRADEVRGITVEAIEYSAYEKMVNAEAEKIIDEIKSEFTDVRSVLIIHSAGIVEAGSLSLFVVASACHRQQAIAACSKTVELIKGRLPVWKKEILRDGSREWK